MATALQVLRQHAPPAAAGTAAAAATATVVAMALLIRQAEEAATAAVTAQAGVEVQDHAGHAQAPASRIRLLK